MHLYPQILAHQFGGNSWRTVMRLKTKTATNMNHSSRARFDLCDAHLSVADIARFPPQVFVANAGYFSQPPRAGRASCSGVMPLQRIGDFDPLATNAYVCSSVAAALQIPAANDFGCSARVP